MKNDEHKPAVIANELEGLKHFLGENIPTLDESIPILDELVEIPQDIKVSFDSSHSTETIEQQLIRTRHEQQAPAPKLVKDEIPILDEPVRALLTDVSSSNYKIDPVDFNRQDQFQQLDKGSGTGLPQDHEQEGSNLEEQQFDIESESITLRTEKNIDDLDNEILLEKAWEKVEMLLMDNLPTELSGAFLQLLNSQINANKQQIFDELSLLDSEMFQALNHALENDLNDGFDDEGF